jgi:hypothetical protein
LKKQAIHFGKMNCRVNYLSIDVKSATTSEIALAVREASRFKTRLSRCVDFATAYAIVPTDAAKVKPDKIFPTNIFFNLRYFYL